MHTSQTSRARARARFAIGAFAVLSVFGPPQITVRAAVAGATGVPAGAVLLIDGKHHSDHGGLAVTGRAETMRAGKRVTLPLTLLRTGTDSYAVTRQWEVGTPWVLVFSAEQAEQGNHGLAEALVKIDARGVIVGIEHAKANIVANAKVARIGEREVAAALAMIAPR